MPRSQAQCFVTNAKMERDLCLIFLSLVIIINNIFIHCCLFLVFFKDEFVIMFQESRLLSHALMTMDKSIRQEKRQLIGLEVM